MIDGRYGSLGLAVYSALQAPPTHPAFGGKPIHAWLINGLKGIKPFLQQNLQTMQKDAQNWSPEIAQSRQMSIEQVQEEIRWLKDAIDRIEQMEKNKAYSQFHEVEISKDETQP